MSRLTKFCWTSIRNISRSAQRCRCEDNPSINKAANLHKVNNFERKLLVWSGKFKSVEEVPDRVASEVVDRARNRMRIRVANIMMAVTLVGCIFVSISGKRAHDRGESVLKSNLEWHKSQNEADTK